MPLFQPSADVMASIIRQNLEPMSKHFGQWLVIIESAINCNSTTLSAGNRSVHRLRPSGGVEQASAVILACCFPLNFGGFPDRGRSSIADSNPPSTYFCCIRRIVSNAISRVRLILPFDSFLSDNKIWHRVIFRAFASPFLTISWSPLRSFALRWICIFFSSRYPLWE